MDTSHRSFAFPERFLADIDPNTLSSLLETAADVALVLDDEGIIQDVACTDTDALPANFNSWPGSTWSSTVTADSRDKVDALLNDAGNVTAPRWRQVNHPAVDGDNDVPIRYTAIRLGKTGRIIAIGKEMRALAQLQQRLVDAQQSMERDYSRLRQAEMRYRLLFQEAMEAVLIIDSTTHRVVEGNPAAARIAGLAPEAIVGKVFPDDFHCSRPNEVLSLYAGLLSNGKADSVGIALCEEQHHYLLSGSLVRNGTDTHFLLRLSPQGSTQVTPPRSNGERELEMIVERMPDAFVVTDAEGRIVTANRAFLDLAQLGSAGQVRGEQLARWLGRPGVDMNVMRSNLRQHGTLRLFQTHLRGEYGSETEVEISAVNVPEMQQPCMAFTIRSVGSRLRKSMGNTQNLPRSVEQLTELVGRVPLKDLVREATDVIERLCIEAALETTSDNRASAAEMLGLSRQSLYVKMRRFGLSDTAADS